MLKRQQFEDGGSDKIEPRDSKYQRWDVRNDEEGESLDEFEGEGEEDDIGYVSLPFVTLPWKKSNRLTDMGEGTKNLNHLVCISKIG